MKILEKISFRKFLTPGWRSRGAATPPASTPTDSFQVSLLMLILVLVMVVAMIVVLGMPKAAVDGVT